MMKRVTFLINEKELEKVKDKAWENKKNLSEYIRQIIKESLEK